MFYEQDLDPRGLIKSRAEKLAEELSCALELVAETQDELARRQLTVESLTKQKRQFDEWLAEHA